MDNDALYKKVWDAIFELLKDKSVTPEKTIENLESLKKSIDDLIVGFIDMLEFIQREVEKELGG